MRLGEGKKRGDGQRPAKRGADFGLPKGKKRPPKKNVSALKKMTG